MNKTINKIIQTVERKFSYYPKTKEVLDLKEELISIMIDKYNDLDGMNEKQKYKECMDVMMSSYKEVLHDLEVQSSNSILKTKILSFSFISTIYFVLAVLIYILVDKLLIHNLSKSSVVIISFVLVYPLLLTIFLERYSKKMNFKVLQRIWYGLSFFTLATLLYVLPNIILSVLFNINKWHPTWLIILTVGYIYLLCDKIKYPHKTPKKRLVRNCLNLGALFTVIYLIFSILTGLWQLSWLIYLLLIISIEANILLYSKNKI